MNVHKRIHAGIKPFKCDVDICKKKFSLRSDLINHFRNHLGENPYGCPECRKWFTQSSTRNKHISANHKQLSKEQQSEMKCKLPRSIVYDYPV